MSLKHLAGVIHTSAVHRSLFSPFPPPLAWCVSPAEAAALKMDDY